MLVLCLLFVVISFIAVINIAYTSNLSLLLLTLLILLQILRLWLKLSQEMETIMVTLLVML